MIKMCLIKYFFLSCFYCLTMTSWINENETDSQLFESDIEGVPQDESYTDEFHAPFSWKYSLWPNGTVPYAFKPYTTDFSVVEKKLIEAFMRELSSRTCIKFIPVPNENIHHVLITHAQTCRSKVGRIINPNQPWQHLHLAKPCINRNDVLHELMHVLGFLHEHNRPDRDEYVTINWENIMDGKNISFKKQPSLHVTNANKSYDYKSITHYPSTALSKNGEETITAKRPGEHLKADGLSDMDVQKINELYNCGKETKFIASDKRPELTTTSTIEVGVRFSEPLCPKLAEMAENILVENGNDYVKANGEFYNFLTTTYGGLNFASIFGRTYFLMSSYDGALCQPENLLLNGTLKVTFFRSVPNYPTVGLDCGMYETKLKQVYQQNNRNLRQTVIKTYKELRTMDPTQYFLVLCDRKHEYNKNFQNLKINKDYEDKICNVSLTDDVNCIGLKH